MDGAQHNAGVGATDLADPLTAAHRRCGQRFRGVQPSPAQRQERSGTDARPGGCTTPSSTKERTMLVPELTHVVQQRNKREAAANAERAMPAAA
jgi:hypothetical protein